MSIDTFIRGDSRIICLFGNPVAHSLSPQIHNHAFRELALPYVYIPVLVPPERLHTAMYALRSLGWQGANVTIPHKAGVVHYCDELSELSRKTGTVNTLYLKNGGLAGTTTDPEGFRRAVAKMGIELERSHVVVLGNGGTARTLSIALALEKKIASLSLIGRNFARVASLAREIETITGFSVQTSTLESSSVEEHMSRCTLLVNCTSVGMYPETEKTPLPSRYFHKGMAVFDVIYNPVRTRFLQEASAAGCSVQNGLSMLLYQGLASFKLWTGIEAPETLFDLTELEKMICH